MTCHAKSIKFGLTFIPRWTDTVLHNLCLEIQTQLRCLFTKVALHHYIYLGIALLVKLFYL